MGAADYGMEVEEGTRRSLEKHLQSVLVLVLAAIAAASMWFYVIGVLRAHQIADAEAKQIPRGFLSDLYPRWLGTRELLLRHRNPYSRDVTLDIQEGYYGRRLDAARPNDPKDQQGFAYPVYVVFLLAPLIGLPFHAVQIFYSWLLLGLTAGSVCLWLRALRWRLSMTATATCIVLTLGSFPAVQGIRLQQFSLLVAALLAGAAACVASGWFFLGGVLLALATIKPQLAGPPVIWLLAWALSDWRARRKLAFGFGLVMVLLLAGAEIVLPGWWRMFAEAIQQYHQYTQNRSVLDQIMPWGGAGEILGAMAALGCVFSLWKLRHEASDSEDFGRTLALVMALTVLVVPMYAPYNQVLLLPAILVLLQDRTLVAKKPIGNRSSGERSSGKTSTEKSVTASRLNGARLGYAAAALALMWQWIATVSLSGAYFLVSPAWTLRRWEWPFFATFALPVLIFLLILIDVRGKHMATQRRTLMRERAVT